MKSHTRGFPLLFLSLASALVAAACLTPATYASTTVVYRSSSSSSSSSFDPNDVTIAEFEAELAPYGQWMYVPGVGRVWRPYEKVVGRSFQPYSTGGEWILTNHGWVFQSRWSWGWVPFHYGRWTLHAAHGWVWVPDTVWAPAWVDWRIGDGYVGWAPLPPAGMRIDVFGPSWVFVKSAHFGVSNWHTHIIRGPRVRSVWSKTRPYRHRVNRGRVYWYSGPSRQHVRYPRVRELPPPRRHARPAPQRPAVQRPAVQRPAPSRPTPARKDAVRPTPSRPSERSRPEPARPAPRRNESRQRLEPSRPSPSKPAPSRPTPARPAPSRPSQSSSLNRIQATPVAIQRPTPSPSASSTAKSRPSAVRSQGQSTSSRPTLVRPSSSSSRSGEVRNVRARPARVSPSRD